MRPFHAAALSRMRGEDLLVDGEGLIGVVALEIDGGKLQFERDGGLMAGGDLEFLRALEHSLRDVKLIGLLIDGAELGKEAGIAKSGFVGGRGDALHVADGLRVLAQLVMRADEAHPGRDICRVGR